MATDTTTSRGAEALNRAREWLRTAGPRGLAGRPELMLAPEGELPAPMGDPALDEALAYDALARERPTWAAACIQAAVTGYEAAGRGQEAAHALEAWGHIVDGCFEPYGSDLALLDDVAAWLRQRLTDLHVARRAAARAVREGDGPDDERADADLDGATTALHQRWVFRLHRTRRAGRPPRVDRFAELLGLGGLDRYWVLGLLAIERDPVFDGLRRRWFSDDGHLTTGLVAALLAEGADAEVALIERLDVQAPLVHHRVVHVNAPAGRPQTGLRNRLVELDDCASAFVEGRRRWPPGIDNVVGWHPPSERPAPSAFQDKVAQIERAVARLAEREVPSTLALCGPTRDTTRGLLEAWSRVAGRPVLRVAAYWMFREPTPFERLFRLVVREALLRNAVVYVDGARRWREGGDGAEEVLAAIVRCQRHLGQPVFFDAPVDGDETLRRVCSDLFEVRVLPPTFDDQVALWNDALRSEGLEELDEGTIRGEVLDIALNVEDVERSVRLARNQAWLWADDGAPVSVEAAALRAMAASKLSEGLHGVAERVRVGHSWHDIVLDDETLTRLMEIITYQRYRRQVYEEWGFGAKVAYGRANSSLFTGPPGTGKTMAAGIIARDLGMDLYRVDLSQVTSKYVGETEKNLGRVFDEASRAYSVLLFDEADSLFGKRTSMESSHDRYGNLEVNYLLQRIETYDGVTILTSNFPQNIDDAFVRRIKVRVDFAFPGADERARLWRAMLPRDAAVEDNVDFARLGKVFELSGGNIKNAVLRAAFMAAEAGSSMTMAHFEQAGTLEARAAGKLVRFQDGRPVPTSGQAEKALRRMGDAALGAPSVSEGAPG